MTSAVTRTTGVLPRMLASGVSICVNNRPRLTHARENTHMPGQVIARNFKANVKEPELIRRHSSISAVLPDNRRVSDQTATIPKSTAATTATAGHPEATPHTTTAPNPGTAGTLRSHGGSHLIIGGLVLAGCPHPESDRREHGDHRRSELQEFPADRQGPHGSWGGRNPTVCVLGTHTGRRVLDLQKKE